MNLRYLKFIFLTLILVSCNVTPEKIAYGKDHCFNCDMTVVDKTHAAEFVTKKGRSYSFDAIECLVMKINKEQNEDNYAFILVTDYLNPGKLIDVKKAYFLICENIKSPMGANLSGFSSKEEAIKTQKEFGGIIYSWEELKIKLVN